jgi:signal transduction histidine kinase
VTDKRLSRGPLHEQTYRVLVADDDPHLRSMLRRMLEKQHYEVIEATNGQECLDFFREIGPDIIVMDVMMPVLDGLNACSRLRAMPGGESIPVVMISVLDDYRSVARAFEAGATDYITKPLNAQVLTNRLQYMLHAARTEQLISRAKNEWEATFDSVSDLIIVTDVEGRIVRCNRATADRIGAPFATIIGWPIADVVFGGVMPAGIEKDTIGHEMDLPALAGCFLVTTYPIRVEGTLEGMVYIIRDVTERKQLEARMLVSQKMADLGALAAGVAHEINSPLQVITGVSQSLLDRHACGQLEAERLQKGLVTIHRSGWRCAEIVRALRTYAHAATANIVPTNLNEVVTDTLLLIENQLKSWSSISVVTALAPELPTLHCDRNQITQLLINLLTNARDAMPRGGTVTIRTGLADDGETLLLSVSDNGVGIPDTIQSRLFDPFFTTKPPGQGTGLGLSIVAGIVQAHHGEVHLASAVGQGTTFTVSLPCLPAGAAEAPLERAAIADRAGGPGERIEEG